MLQNRRILWPSYLVAFTLAIIPPVDALMQTMPVRLGDTRWRWGAFGLLSNAMMIPMIGVLLAFVVASMFEHRTLQKVIGTITAVIAAFVLIGLGLFALDALQLHKDVKPAMAMAFNVACLTASIKALVGVATMAGFTAAAFTGQKKKTQPASASMMMAGSKRGPMASSPVSAAPVVEAK